MQKMNGTQTLSRAIDILFALSEANGTLTVGEIAQKVNIPESTTYRFLQTLERSGIVERRGKSRIGLGLRIFDLARSLNEQVHRDLLTFALPIMEKLTDETGETSVLFVGSSNQAICIQRVKSSQLIQFSIENGRVLPLHLGASGKSILAFENDKRIESVMEMLPSAFERERLQKELNEIRLQGYSFTNGEVDSNVFAVAAPILDAHGMIIASLAICGPNFRCQAGQEAGFVRKVCDSAERLSRKLGNPEDDIVDISKFR
ncbi:IclR family transcriptional regulator [Paenibacillus antibioticophila]|uniref:IclR family transcriptional regulator n=2 Tax=Paenibacillus antibioticophila TaxID=1274374 RepID=A0A919Y0C9_9BACL|nr:IclR family transcriptional regulator [Paenibacillus antibioticophila]